MTVAFLGKHSKQSSESLDYDVDYSDWFSNRSDAPSTFSVSGTSGVTVSGSRSGNVINVLVSGGTAGVQYEVTILLTTTTGRVKEANFLVKIKDI